MENKIFGLKQCVDFIKPTEIEVTVNSLALSNHHLTNTRQ